MLPKHFKIFFSAAALLIALLVSNISYSQTDYNMSLTQPVIINENVLEFAVYIRSISGNFYLTSYQCSFLFNSAIAKGGNLSFTYVEGSSQLRNVPSFGIGINLIDNVPKLTFASMADLDTISEMQKLVGKFWLQNTSPFANSNLNITWSFDGIVTTLLTDETFQNITVPANHTYNVTLGFDSQNSPILDEYNLFQNYPNPFNPSTKLKYSIPNVGTQRAVSVQLKVYDVLGNEVAVLVDEFKEAGVYEVDFDASSLASGMYLYRLQTGDFTATKKLILVR